MLFERFLDPNRSEAPDIDIDFCQDRREEVIAYVKRKYGEESVAQIGTFGTMAARAAIKDVGRVLDVPLDRVNQLTNMVPKTLGITLDEALQQSGELKQAYQSDPAVRELIDIARKLEGTNRNAGTHAAGVVIANGPLSDYVPLQRVVRKGEDAGSRSGEAVVTTQWVMGDLEKVGLLKMDFLGLRTSDIAGQGGAADREDARRKDRRVQAAAGRPGDVSAVAARRRQGRVPVRVRRHPRIAQAAAAGQHPRHHRLHGAVSSRPARRRHGGRLHQLQARPREAGLSAPGHGGNPRAKPTASWSIKNR